MVIENKVTRLERDLTLVAPYSFLILSFNLRVRVSYRARSARTIPAGGIYNNR